MEDFFANFDRPVIGSGPPVIQTGGPLTFLVFVDLLLVIGVDESHAGAVGRLSVMLCVGRRSLDGAEVENSRVKHVSCVTIPLMEPQPDHTNPAKLLPHRSQKTLLASSPLQCLNLADGRMHRLAVNAGEPLTLAQDDVDNLLLQSKAESLHVPHLFSNLGASLGLHRLPRCLLDHFRDFLQRLTMAPEGACLSGLASQHTAVGRKHDLPVGHGHLCSLGRELDGVATDNPVADAADASDDDQPTLPKRGDGLRDTRAKLEADVANARLSALVQIHQH